MGKPNFAKLEAEIKSRKWPVYMADMKVSYDYISGYKFTDKKLLPHPKDLAELIYKLLGQRSGSVYVIGNSAKPGLRVQCRKGAQRSIQDLFKIAINYTDNLSYKKLYKLVDEMVHGEQRDGVVRKKLFNSHFCSLVRKQVHTRAQLNCTEETVREALGKNNIIFK